MEILLHIETNSFSELQGNLQVVFKVAYRFEYVLSDFEIDWRVKCVPVAKLWCELYDQQT